MLEGGFRAFTRKSFDAAAPLNVVFVGETGIDDGGLTVEFLRLFLGGLTSLARLFSGDKEKMLALDEKCMYCTTTLDDRFLNSYLVSDIYVFV